MLTFSPRTIEDLGRSTPLINTELKKAVADDVEGVTP
jgi:hypothetical protein